MEKIEVEVDVIGDLLGAEEPRSTSVGGMPDLADMNPFGPDVEEKEN